MILLTGASGFLGRHAARRLLAAGEPVRALVRRPEGFAGDFPGIEVAEGDLADPSSLERALDGVDAVVHLAGKNVDHDGTGFEATNVEGTRALVGRAVAAGVERLVYVSSVGVYGHGAHDLADETTPLAPDTPFSRSKAAAERLVLDRHQAGELEAVVLRHRFVYGEGDRAVVPRLMKAARRYPFWVGGGRARMSMVWAPDFAEVILRAARGAARGEADPVYHVTDGRPISFREAVETLCREFGFRGPRFSLPFAPLYALLRLRERLLGIDPEVADTSLTSLRLQLVAQENTFSNRRLTELLPDLDFVPFAEGVARSRQWYERFTGDGDDGDRGA